jgi:hypothetical protein
MRIDLDGEDAMVGTIQLDHVVQPIHQVQPVVSQKREDRIEAFLQMPMWEQSIREELGFGDGAIVTAQSFARDLEARLLNLVLIFPRPFSSEAASVGSNRFNSSRSPSNWRAIRSARP